MFARELSQGDAFVYRGKMYVVKFVKIIRGHVKVKTYSGQLSLRPDEQLELM
jgi:hypothetical protein